MVGDSKNEKDFTNTRLGILREDPKMEMLTQHLLAWVKSGLHPPAQLWDAVKGLKTTRG